MSDDTTFDLSRFPVHLALGAKVIRQPEHTGELDWYEAYGERCGGDGKEGRLVTIHTFSNRGTAAWATEATHPALPGVVVHGSAIIEWLEGERFLIQRARSDH